MGPGAVARGASDRDRVVDLVRVASILCVVLGHWLMTVVTYRSGRFDGENALTVVPDLWVLTWVLQVMPLFFFVGGFANARGWTSTLARGGTYVTYVRVRAARLLHPTVAFVAVWLVLAAVVPQLGLGTSDVERLGGIVARPLWFVGLYLAVVALAPPMLHLHRRARIAVPVVLVAGAVAVDVARVGLDVTWVGAANYALVWLLAHQLGFLYADGTLPALSRTAAAGLLVGGLGALLLLTSVGPYPRSMVGLAGDAFSNMDPPTVAIVALLAWQVGGLLLLREPLSRWLRRPRVWAAVVRLGAVAMTVFLWHLSSLLPVAGGLLPAGFPQPPVGSLVWWAWRPVWLAALTGVLVLLVAGLGRVEVAGHARAADIRAAAARAPGDGASVVAAIGVGASVLGVLGFAVAGFSDLLTSDGALLLGLRLSPLLAVFHLALGGSLLAAAGRWPAARARVLTAAVLTLVITAAATAGVGFTLNRPVAALHLAAVALLAGAWHASGAQGTTGPVEAGRPRPAGRPVDPSLPVSSSVRSKGTWSRARR